MFSTELTSKAGGRRTLWVAVAALLTAGTAYAIDPAGKATVVTPVAPVKIIPLSTTDPPPPNRCHGDVNNDGFVDQTDLAEVLAWFGTAVDLDSPIGAVLADVDGNGVVDQSDLATVLADFGVTCPYCHGDLDGDGFIGVADLGILMEAFGVHAGGDLNLDGETDQVDLAILLAKFGSACP